MQITVNGKQVAITEHMTVYALLQQIGLNPDRVVVERNRELVESGKFATTQLQDGDSLEVLHFVGGG